MRVKVKYAGLLTVLLVWSVFVAGCASTPIEKSYPERWEKTYIGMSLEEFKQVWPEATWGGDTQDEGESYVFTSPYIPLFTGKLAFEYFIFKDDKLVKYRGVN